MQLKAGAACLRSLHTFLRIFREHLAGNLEGCNYILGSHRIRNHGCRNQLCQAFWWLPFQFVQEWGNLIREFH